MWCNLPISYWTSLNRKTDRAPTSPCGPPVQTLCIRPDMLGCTSSGLERLTSADALSGAWLHAGLPPRQTRMRGFVCLSLPHALPRPYFERFFRGTRFDAVQSLQLGILQRHGEGYMFLPTRWTNVAARLKTIKTLALNRHADPRMPSRYPFSALDEAGYRSHFPLLRQLCISGLGIEERKANESWTCEPVVIQLSSRTY